MKRHLALLCLPFLASACRAAREEPETKPVVSVTVTTARLSDVQASLTAPATLHPREQASIASRTALPILELLARKGDHVAAGAPLVRLDNRDLVAQRTEILAAVHQAEVVAARRDELFKEGAIPERERLAAETDLAQAKARLEQIDAQVAFSELRSPFAGVVTEQFLFPGDLAQPSNPVFTIADVRTVVARAQVSPGEAPQVRPGQSCTFSSSDDATRSAAGRVTVVNSAMDPARQTVEVWCEIANADGRLRPGAFGQVTVLTGRLPHSVVVPLEAVQFAEGTHEGRVYVVDEKRIAHQRDVEGGAVFDDQVQILHGLEAGETVVVEGSYALPDGAEVKVRADAEKDER